MRAKGSLTKNLIVNKHAKTTFFRFDGGGD